MGEFAFAPPATPAVAIEGGGRFPVHRIYCVGLNYADHIKEIGADATLPPVFFMKPADAAVDSGADVPYPPGTSNFHYEIELVVAIGKPARGVAEERALEHVF